MICKEIGVSIALYVPVVLEVIHQSCEVCAGDRRFLCTVYYGGEALLYLDVYDFRGPGSVASKRLNGFCPTVHEEAASMSKF